MVHHIETAQNNTRCTVQRIETAQNNIKKRKLKLHCDISYSSSPIIFQVMKSRRMRWAMHLTRMGERRGLYMFLVGKPEGKRLLGRPSLRWLDNIKLDLQEVGFGDMDWIELARVMDR
jgi:hypothetical protein